MFVNYAKMENPGPRKTFLNKIQSSMFKCEFKSLIRIVRWVFNNYVQMVFQNFVEIRLILHCFEPLLAWSCLLVYLFGNTRVFALTFKRIQRFSELQWLKFSIMRYSGALGKNIAIYTLLVFNLIYNREYLNENNV